MSGRLRDIGAQINALLTGGNGDDKDVPQRENVSVDHPGLQFLRELRDSLRGGPSQCMYLEAVGGVLTCTELRTSAYGASGANSRRALDSFVPKTDEAIAIPIVPPTVVAKESVPQGVPLRKGATGDSPSCEKETCRDQASELVLAAPLRTESTAYQGSLLRNLVFVVTVGLNLASEVASVRPGCQEGIHCRRKLTAMIGFWRTRPTPIESTCEGKKVSASIFKGLNDKHPLTIWKPIRRDIGVNSVTV